MARQESDRADLWAEAVALTSRVEYQLPDDARPVLIGYRDNGWCSIYVGQELMLQFTPAGGLRRAYRDGELYRTEGQSLSRLTRQRTESETTLLRSELTAVELAELRSLVQETVQRLLDAISSHAAVVQRCLPDDAESAAVRIVETLTQIKDAAEFLAPAIVKRREK